MKISSRIQHICIMRPKNSTSDHADALAAQAANLGVKFCFIHSKIPFTWLGIVVYRLHMILYRSMYVFLSSPYEEHQPKWLIRGNFKLAYAGYGLTISNWEDGHFSSGMISKCRLLLSGSEYEYRGYNKVSHNFQKIVLSGNPLMWQIRDQIPRKVNGRLKVQQILWAPHWTSTWFDSHHGYSRWREKTPVIFEFAKLHPEIKIVFRPHPLLKDALFKSPNKYEKIYQREIKKSLDPRLDNFVVERIHEMLNLPNVFLSTGTLPEDILESDALITSGVSIIGYFAATGKPMLIYRDSNSPEFGQNGSGLLPFFEVAKNTTELLSWLQSIIKLDNLEINHHGVKKCHEIFPTFDKSPLQIALES